MRTELRSWVERGFPGAAVSELAGDASSRRFFRLLLPTGSTRVLMDYGSPFRDRSDDQKLSAIFAKAGLPVARILRAAPEPGCLVLEDLGDRLLEHEFGEAGALGLWLHAAELAGRIAREGSPVLRASDRRDGPFLDAVRFRFEMTFFLENFVQKYKKIRGDQAELRGLLEDLADRTARTENPVLCHRDFHSRNLMVRPDRTLAMVDIQDARWGPETYDVASLVFDAYVDLDQGWFEPLVTRYLETAGIEDGDDLRRRFHRVGAQRMIKALGTFGYQLAVADNRRYMDAIPRTLARLDRWLARERETSALHEKFRSLGLFAADP